MRSNVMDRLARALIDVFGEDHVEKDSLSVFVGDAHSDFEWLEREVVIKFKHIVKC